MAEGEVRAFDLEPVAAGVDEIRQRDTAADVGQVAAGDDGDAHLGGLAQRREVRPHLGIEIRVGGVRDDGRERAVVVGHEQQPAAAREPVGEPCEDALKVVTHGHRSTLTHSAKTAEEER